MPLYLLYSKIVLVSLVSFWRWENWGLKMLHKIIIQLYFNKKKLKEKKCWITFLYCQSHMAIECLSWNLNSHLSKFKFHFLSQSHSQLKLCCDHSEDLAVLRPSKYRHLSMIFIHTCYLLYFTVSSHFLSLFHPWSATSPSVLVIYYHKFFTPWRWNITTSPGLRRTFLVHNHPNQWL